MVDHSAMKQNDREASAFSVIVVFFLSACFGIGAAGVASRLQNESERQWRAVGDVGELGRNLESLQVLRARSLVVNEAGRVSILYTADFTATEIAAAIERLTRSGVLPLEVAKVAQQVRGYEQSILAGFAEKGEKQQPPADELLDPSYVPIRLAVAELGQQMKGAAVKSGRRISLLTWTFYPGLFLVCGVMFARNARNRRLVVQRVTAQREGAKFEALVSGSRDVITVIDSQGHFVYASPAAARVFGRTVSELTQLGLTTLLTPDDFDHFVNANAEVCASSRTLTIEALVECSGGIRRYFELTGSEAASTGLKGTLWTWHDIHDRKTLENELKHQAYHDPLTSLANRALFQNRLEHTLAQAGRTGATTCLLFIDLDGFKTVNDSLGHEAGDAVLSHLAGSLQSILRPGDTLARLGGDEFAVLLEATDEALAHGLAARVLQKARESFSVPIAGESNVEVILSASIGFATTTGTTSAVELLRNADMAMYAAKNSGKNCVRSYSEDMHNVANDRLRLQSELRHALARDEFRIHYQPLVDLSVGQVVGFEALIRWEHPQRGLLAPALFVPIAEENGAIVEIGRWVIAAAARDAALMNKDAVRPLKINVNLSPKQLRDAELVTILKAALHDYDLDPRALVLEITETALLDDISEARVVLEQIRALGIKLALDDFGTGYSTLSSLRSLPIDIVKIDRSFLETNGCDDRSQLLTESIIAMGRQLGLETVAEGIETEAQLERMRDLGCGSGQGYLFSKAVPLSEIDRVVKEIQGDLQAQQQARIGRALIGSSS
jgi:diguanylate cyclase (GGDEF)-like protein/PAS domain S-box-containing protein